MGGLYNLGESPGDRRFRDTEILKAIHDLELAVNKQLHLLATTVEVNSQRLHNLCETVDRQSRHLYGSPDGDQPGLLTRMRDLERSDKERRWTLRTVTASFIGLSVKFLYDTLSHL